MWRSLTRWPTAKQKSTKTLKVFGGGIPLDLTKKKGDSEEWSWPISHINPAINT